MPDWKELTGEDTPMEKADKRIKKLESALKGIAGGSVYRHSHQDVSYELDAVRRFATVTLRR